MKTIREIHDSFDQKRISARELVGQYLAASKQSELGACLTICEERALEQAQAADDRIARDGRVARSKFPLLGIPIGIKDVLVTEGVKTTCASRMLENYVPPYTATAVARLEAAGAIVISKLNMDEFAMGGSNENSAFGPVKHPTHPDRVPGGSSGGSAAAVKAGLCHAALGTDTGGSIRLPASYCGVVGLKPTYGRVSRYGMVAFASSLDQIGPLTQSVEDAAVILEVMSGHDPLDSTSAPKPSPTLSASLAQAPDFKKLRIGVPQEFFSTGLNPDVERAIQASLSWFEERGAKLVPVSLKLAPLSIAVYYLVAVSEASSNLARFDGVRFGQRTPKADSATALGQFYSENRSLFGPEVKRRILLGTFALSSGYTDAYYRRACQVRRLIQQELDQVFKSVDLIAGPVSPTTAFKLGEKVSDPLQMYLNDVFTVLANLAGLPALSVPCGEDSQGLPIGFHLMAPAYAEDKLLSAAHAFETGEEGMSAFDTVIGLEVHCQLSTETKIFCGCPSKPSAGKSVSEVPSNASTCPICTGQPGSLPVLNRRAVEYAIRAGIATECKIRDQNVFARKNYFYPDLPKGYQISQFDLPICYDGSLEIFLEGGVRKKITIQRIHLEEDAGKNVHLGAYSLVNLNRAGVPLVEIVSAPEMSSAQEAGAYLRALHEVVTCLKITDGNMQEGNFRCDANVSVKPRGSSKLGTRVEIKNINSFRFVEKAIEFEVSRQIALVQAGQAVVQETRLYDSARNSTASMRSKEEAMDYRYFPDPDLMPVAISPAWIESVKADLPELLAGRRARFQERSGFGLSEQDAIAVTASRGMAEYFEMTTDLAHQAGVERIAAAKLTANLLVGEVARLANEGGIEIDLNILFKPDQLAEAVRFLESKAVSSTGAKQAIAEAWVTHDSFGAIVERLGLKQVSDSGALEPIVARVIAAHPAQVAEFRGGKEKVLGFLVGQLMKETGGKANPGLLQQLLRKKLSE